MAKADWSDAPPLRLALESSEFAGQSGKGELRRQNRRTILASILATGGLSRVQLGRRTGLSPATVGHIVGELFREGYLVESGIVDLERGRKPRLLRVNPHAASVVGVDLTDMVAATFDLDCGATTPYEPIIESGDLVTPEQVVDAIAEFVGRISADAPAPKLIGVSVPGSVDAKNGVVLSSAPLNWFAVPIGRLVAERTGIPVVVERNVICLALNEVWAGEMKPPSNFVYVSAGMRGIGAGIVANGEIVYGGHSAAGEIGHIRVDPEGPACHCGKRGCLEAIASSRAVVQRVQQNLASSGAFDPPRSFSDVVRLADAGEPVAREAIEEAARMIGETLGDMFAFVNPELIIVGGNFMEAGAIALDVMKQAAEGRASRRVSKPIRIVAATDSPKAASRGVARMALHRLLLDLDISDSA